MITSMTSQYHKLILLCESFFFYFASIDSFPLFYYLPTKTSAKYISMPCKRAVLELSWRNWVYKSRKIKVSLVYHRTQYFMVKKNVSNHCWPYLIAFILGCNIAMMDIILVVVVFTTFCGIIFLVTLERNCW